MAISIDEYAKALKSLEDALQAHNDQSDEHLKEMLRDASIRRFEFCKAKGAKVWAFGSRATGRHRPFSDVDLLFEGPTGRPIDDGFLYDIKTNLEESDFPFKLDLVNRSQLAESYRAQVESEMVEL